MSYEIFCKELHSIILKKMKTTKITQTVLANSLNKSQSTICEILKRLDNGKEVNLKTIFAITNILKIKIEIKN